MKPNQDLLVDIDMFGGILEVLGEFGCFFKNFVKMGFLCDNMVKLVRDYVLEMNLQMYKGYYNGKEKSDEENEDVQKRE
jgi:hypothetical protein